MIDFPSTKTIKDAIRAEIGLTATFTIRGDSAACPTCSGSDLFDSVNNVSLDPFCDTCSGVYWITQDVVSGVVSHVRWRTGDESDHGIGGEVFTGDCSITIDIDALTADQISKIKYVVVDDRKLEIFRTIKRGVPTRDRIRFSCREVGKE